MAGRALTERIALFVCLPLLIFVSFATWRLWQHVSSLEQSLAVSKETEVNLLAKVRDALGREELAGRALQHAMLERDVARTASEKAREQFREAQAEADRQGRIAERLRRQRVSELDRMRDVLAMIAETDRTPMGMVVQLTEDSFLFDFDSDELRPKNREILSRIAGVLLASYGYRVFVYGHTDDQGAADYNRDLSERRARSVREYLTGAGIPGAILEAKGFGESSPRVPGTSRAARSKNRRVEIGIVDTVVDYSGEVAGTSP